MRRGVLVGGPSWDQGAEPPPRSGEERHVPGSGALQGFRHLPLVGHRRRAAGWSEGWLKPHTNKVLIPCSGEIALCR